MGHLCVFAILWLDGGKINIEGFRVLAPGLAEHTL